MLSPQQSGKIIADTLSVRATTLMVTACCRAPVHWRLLATPSQGSHGRWLTADDPSSGAKHRIPQGPAGQNITVQADRWANSGSVLATGNHCFGNRSADQYRRYHEPGDITLKAATTDNRSPAFVRHASLDGIHR